VDAVGVGQSEVVAHGIPEADLVQLEFRLAWQAVQESACCRRPRLRRIMTRETWE
jgi:hypothetical protein